MNKSIRKAILFCAYACLMVWPVLLLAESHEHEQHGKHVHGEGELRLVLEDQNLEMEFIVPAMNVVGFEHEAESDKQKKAIRDAVAILKNNNRVFALPSEASCKLQSVEARHVILGKDEHEEGHHQDEKHQEEEKHGEEGHHQDEEHHEEAKHGEEGHHEEEHHEEHESGHAEFKSHYAYQCLHPEKLKTVELRVFKEFEGIEHIDVALVVSTKQSSQELAANKPVIELEECRFGFGSWCLF